MEMLLKNTANSRYRKELGQWGETQLDLWMHQQGWQCLEKNLKIRGGEIDRVYLNDAGQHKKLCVAEVKTNFINSAKEFVETFSEVGLRKYLKQRQIRNIYRYGEYLLAKNANDIMLFPRRRESISLFLRFFLVLKLRRHSEQSEGSRLKEEILRFAQNDAIKICHFDRGLIIISFEPEFTTIQARKGLLQVKI